MPKGNPQGYQLPAMPPAATAALREDISAYRIDWTAGDTDMGFDLWLRTQRPERYRLFQQLTGQGRHGG